MRTSKVGIWTEQGFTLIELIIALFVGVLLVSIIAAYGYVQGVQGLQGASRSLIGMVRTAYTLAVASRHVQHLCVELAHGEVWITRQVCSEKVEGEKAGQAEAPYIALSTGIRVLDVQTADQGTISQGVGTILFFPLGRAERGVIHLEDQFHNQISLLIQPVTGMVTVQDGYTNGNVVSSGFSDGMQ